ncbi:MAG: SIMPL domain-containing protein [Actinobacteria bacterium]|nr:SIMPL domain-containing protein [Actinomycetota bacterium]
MRLLAILAVGLALLAGGASAATTDSATTDTVTVTGTGSVTAVPDQAEFDFTVSTKGMTASDALDANGKTTSAVIAAVEKAGVDETDIQTQGVSLDPVTSSDGTKITGYTASGTIDVTKLPIAKAGDVVDAAVGAGANGVSGPNLTVSSQDTLYAQALTAAVAQAKSKAQTLAGAAGRTLGAVTTIVEGGSTPPVPFAEGAAKGSSTPIEAGTQQIQATVTVTYALS